MVHRRKGRADWQFAQYPSRMSCYKIQPLSLGDRRCGFECTLISADLKRETLMLQKRRFQVRLFQIRLTVLLLLLSAFSFLPRTASADVGQYVILSAQYGTARHHVDVTQRLKEIASADQPFRMGNRSFGMDPDPGVVKVLRIYARGPDGRERMFEYQEGSVVDGAQFRSWHGGNWDGGGPGPGPGGDAGGYVILSAQYGSARSHVDVTQRLKELARADVTF